MAKNHDKRQVHADIKKKGGELPFFKKANESLQLEKIEVSAAEKRALEFASDRKHKEVIELVDGYASCVEKKWIDPDTKELTNSGRKAHAAALFMR